MRENYRKSIASMKKFPQFTTMNVIDGQAGLIICASLIFYSLTIDNILNIIVLLILAAVAISAVSGENGILSNATKAKQNNEKGEAEDSIKLILNEWPIEKYTGTKTLKEFLESKFTNVTDNGDGTYTVELKGYEATVDADGNIIGEITKAGPKPVVDESSIVITLEDGTTVPEDNSLTSGTILKVTFTASIEGGEITSITPADGLTDGTQTEIEFTIVGTVNGVEYTTTKVISVAHKYKILNSEAIVPTITATGNFANNANIKEVRQGDIPVPTGFTYIKGNKQGGAVIRNDEDNSEFVWVPVSDVTTMYGTLEDGTKAGKLYNFTSSGTTALNWTESEIDGKNVMSITDTSSTGSYREPDTISSCDGDSTYLNIIKSILTDEESQSNYANKTSFKATMQSDFDDMIESISKYGGFYVARYEMTLSSDDKPQFIASTTTESLKNTDAVNSTDTTTNRWYGLYARAKEYKTNSTQGTMIWGSQYDAMMKWMQENGITITETTPTDTGMEQATSKNTTRYPGSVESDRLLNIYDLLGNSYEWTLEAYSTDRRAIRGGDYNFSRTPSYRNNYTADNYGVSISVYSSRSALLIK